MSHRLGEPHFLLLDYDEQGKGEDSIAMQNKPILKNIYMPYKGK